MDFKQHLSTNNKTGGKNSCEYVILHHTATQEGSIAGVLKQLTVGPVSCHYVVDTNGDVYKIGEDTDILRHAGESKRDGKIGMNNYSIGIEILGPLPDGFTDAQRKSVKELVQHLMQTHSIPGEKVIRHKDIAPLRKVDVDDRFRNNQFGSFPEYQKSLSITQIIMQFCEKLWTDEVSKIPAEQRVFRDPAGMFEKLKGLSEEDRLKEVLYLMSTLLQRLKK